MRKRWTAIRALQWITWIVGAALVLCYVAVLAAGEIGRRAGVAVFLAESRMSAPAAPGFEPDVSLWSPQRVQDFRDAASELQSAPLAILRISSLHLAAPIYATSSELHLNLGVGVIEGMMPPDQGGNLGLAGHRDGFFRSLKDIAEGALIEVETRERVHRYRVASVDIVDASDTRLLADTDDPTITLVTCYPFYYVGSAPRRFVVRGEYVWPASFMSTHI